MPGYVTPSLPSPSILYRVGFSKDGTTMNLGEASQSYGFGGTSKAITNSVFVDYGESFGPGDVIGCFVVRRGWGLQCVGVLTHNPPPPLQDFEGELKTISFSKNGTVFGTAFVLSDDALKGVALFPHVMTKNIRVTVNFGGKVGHAHVVTTSFATPCFVCLGYNVSGGSVCAGHRPSFGHCCLSLCRHLPLIPQRGIPPSSKLIRIILSRPKVSQHK